MTRQVFLGASRDYMVETADGTTLADRDRDRKRRFQRRRGLAHAAAGALPGAEPIIRSERESAMKKKKLSRRDVLKGSAALALGTVFPPRRPRPGAAGRSDHAATDRGGEKRRQGGLVHLDRSFGLGEDRSLLQGEIRRHRGAGRAHRRRAGVPAHRPGICQQRPRRRCRQFVRRRASAGMEAAGHPAALRARGRRQTLQARAPRRRRHLCRLPRHAEPDRLQHQAGEGRGRAEKLQGPARSQMEGQDRQGASGLQRHHPDRDLRDGARHRLGVLRERWQSRTSCRCSRRPIRRKSSRSASAA